MTLRQVQRCVSTEPYCVFDVPSQSQDNLIYEVYSSDPEDPAEEYICQCSGFRYRGRCSHQDLAFQHRCMWSELEGPEEQTDQERRDEECPRCGGETLRSTEEVDE